jgi:hypothetical protein
MEQIISQFMLHSGGAKGSDIAWQRIGEEYGLERTNHYFINNFNTPFGNYGIDLDNEMITVIDADLIKANKTLKRSFPTRNAYVNNLLRRNWFQVKNSMAVYAISTITDNLVDGGTGWAVQIAIDKRMPAFVFCQRRKKWFKYNLGIWQETSTPILTEHFAGIGSRELTEDGEKAIREIYLKTIESCTK